MCLGNFMDKNELLNSITPIFREVFDEDDLILTLEMSAKDVDAWDSLSHVRLIVSHEMKFGVKFDTIEINELKNVGDFVELLNKKIA